MTSRGGRGSNDLGRVTYSKLRILLAALAVALVTVAPAASAPDTPNLVGPADGQTVAFLPVFSWDPVNGADKYNFVLAADALFNSPVYTLNGTKNTRATPDKTMPNGTYWWRVQAVDADGNTSPWSAPQSIEKLWADSPTLTAPDDGATISYPDDPLVLRWDPVPGAAKYRIFIATDPALSSLVTSGGDPLETQATNAAPALLLASNTYYWAVTPLDAQGNEGEQSEVRSFTWDWPSTTTPVVNDLIDDTELFVPEFSWDPVPGAARYQVEVNSVSDFPAGASKVCCDSDIPITTNFVPKETFPNNTYYWRVRAVNSHGDAGDWSEGPPFTKTFDNYPDLSELGVKNLHMRERERSRDRRRFGNARLPDRGPDRDLGSSAGGLELPGERGALHERQLPVGRPLLHAVAVHDGVDLVDAPWERPDDEAVPVLGQYLVRYSFARPRPVLLRPGPRAERPRQPQLGRLGRLHPARRRHRGRVHLHGLSRRRCVQPQL